MPLKLYKAGFAVGQIGRQASGRVDIDRYALAAKLIENYEVTPVGTLRHRPGTNIASAAKFPDRDVRLETFEFSIAQAYALEMGHLYIRFYRDRERINTPAGPGNPAVEVATSYIESELIDIQMVQDADVMFFAHSSHPPSRLIRVDDDDWRYEELPLLPGPIVETPFPLPQQVTPSATSGLITLNATTGLWLEADVGRIFKFGTSEAVITEVIPEALGSPYPSQMALAQVTAPFSSVAPINPGEWTLSATPGLDIRVHLDQGNSLGSVVRLKIEDDQIPEIVFANVPQSNNLVLSGDFAVLTGWDDQSGAVVVEGTFTGGSPPQPELVDDTTNFELAGAEVGHRVVNTTTGSEGLVGIIRSIPGATNANSVIDLIPQLAPTGPNWNALETYEIRETGSITHDTVAEQLEIRGGAIGRGAIGQVTAASGADERYLVRVEVRRQPVIVQVASVSPPKFGAAAADLFPETTLEVGTRNFQFKTTGVSNAYLQFSNNQNIDTIIDNVVVFPARRTGWRVDDVGKFVRVAGGMVQITNFVSAFEVTGVIRAVFTDEVDDNNDIIVQQGLWRMGPAAWSANNGYPRAIAIHQQRLWLAGTLEQPNTLWASRVADFSNFQIGPDDADALELEISANEMNAIRWLEPLGDLLVGTAGGEFLIQGGSAGITPSTAFQSPQTTFGSGHIRPIRYDNVVYLVGRGGRDVWELTTDGDTGLLAGRNVTRLVPDITLSGVKEWTIQSYPDSVIWGICEDGRMIGLTLDLSENLRAWHQHTTPGEFLSVAIVPSDDDESERLETAYYAVSRVSGGAPAVFIEVQQRRIDRQNDVREAMTMDCVGRIGDPGGPVNITENTGLAALESQTVGIIERRNYTRPDGRTGELWTNHGTAVVVGGTVTFPQAVASADVGLIIEPRVELLRPALQLRDGNLQFRLQRVVRVDVRTIDTVGFLEVDGELLDVRTPEDLMDTGFPPVDADLSTRSQPGWDGDGFVVITQSLPFPSHLLSVGIEMSVEEME